VQTAKGETQAFRKIDNVEIKIFRVISNLQIRLFCIRILCTEHGDNPLHKCCVQLGSCKLRTVTDVTIL